MKKLFTLLFFTSFCAMASVPQERANPDLLNAIKIAENHTGGYAFKAEREDRYGHQYYSIEIANHAGEQEILWVDINQGKIVNQAPTFVTPEMVESNQYWYKSIENDVNISLRAAILKAERMSGYNALRADYEPNNTYEVDLMNEQGQELELRFSAENSYGHYQR